MRASEAGEERRRGPRRREGRDGDFSLWSGRGQLDVQRLLLRGLTCPRTRQRRKKTRKKPFKPESGEEG